MYALVSEGHPLLSSTDNILKTFGHSGMNALEPYNSAEWANYPEAASWMVRGMAMPINLAHWCYFR